MKKTMKTVKPAENKTATANSQAKKRVRKPRTEEQKAARRAKYAAKRAQAAKNAPVAAPKAPSAKCACKHPKGIVVAKLDVLKLAASVCRICDDAATVLEAVSSINYLAKTSPKGDRSADLDFVAQAACGVAFRLRRVMAGIGEVLDGAKKAADAVPPAKK